MTPPLPAPLPPAGGIEMGNISTGLLVGAVLSYAVVKAMDAWAARR